MKDLMELNKNLIIYFNENKAILLNTKNKDEFEIVEKRYFEYIMNFIYDKSKLSSEVIAELEENNIIVQKVHNEEEEDIFTIRVTNLIHNALKDNFSLSMSQLEPHEFANGYFEKYKDILKKFGYPPITDKEEDYKNVVNLPLPDKKNIKEKSFFEVLDKRKTIREFIEYKMNKFELSNILYNAFGYFHLGKDTEDTGIFKRRTSPSGGCLQIIDPYITIFNCEGIENGTYLYLPENHSLCQINDENEPLTYKDVSEMLSGQFFANNCSIGIFLCANIERMAWKYRTVRNYRVAALEAGHFSQTLQLCCTAEGLKSWITGAFYDSLIEKKIGIEKKKKIVLFFHAIGDGYFKSMHSIMKKAIDSTSTISTK